MLAWNMSLHAREIVAELARRASPSWESADGKLRQWEHHLRERDLDRGEGGKTEGRQNRINVRLFELYGVRPRYGTHCYRLGSQL